MKFRLLIILYFIQYSVSAQFTDRYWTFGEHAAINFSNLSNPVPDTSRLNARGTCASICDSLGNLLFYAASPDDSMVVLPNNLHVGFVLNKLHYRMEDGDSLRTTQLYQEMIIIPDPANHQRFYLFYLGDVSFNAGFYYAIIDLSYNNGLGKVLQKNIRLMNDLICDGVTAVKHGNGRDWWVVVRPYNVTAVMNEYDVFLVTPTGVSSLSPQNIGTPYAGGGFTRLKFNHDGTKLYTSMPANLIERFSFDRCSGLLSNKETITSLSSAPGFDYKWSVEISPDESKLYSTSIYNGSNYDSSFLFQYDLNASNIAASADTLYLFNRNTANGGGPVGGFLKLGPDNKIYLSAFYENQDCGWMWMYCDTSTFYPENMNLSVINYPDSLGAACDFQPYSFYLGGHRTYVSLPNNPNYELGKWVGSPCDTLGTVGVSEISRKKAELFVYYDTGWQRAFINAKGLTGRKYQLKVFDVSGKLLIEQNGNLTDDLFYYGLSLEGWAKGVYVVSLETEREVLSGKIAR